MSKASKRGWVYTLVLIINFIIGLSSFLSTWIFLGMSIFVSILIGLSVILGLFFVSDVASRFTLHSRFLAPIRKTLLYWLSSVVIECWNVTIEIDDEGNALITNEFWGKINFGYMKWIVYGIWTGKSQPKSKDLAVRVFDVKKQVRLTPSFVLDEERYKRIKIRLNQSLKRRQEFHLKVQYRLLKTFYFNKEDYYNHEANHHEKQIHIKVIFPETVTVDYVDGEIITEHGDAWEEHEEPVIVDPHTIEWTISKAMDGNSHKFKWIAKKAIPKP